MLNIKNAGIKKNFELFLWILLGIFALLIIIGLIISIFDPKFQFFSLVTDTFDFVFSILSVFNPITKNIGITFKPIFGGVPNELTNKNPIIMKTLSNAALTTLSISVTAFIMGFVIANITAVILIIPNPKIPIKFIFRIYVDIFRSTPLVLQMLIFAYGVPQLMQTYGITRFIQTLGDHYIIFYVLGHKIVVYALLLSDFRLTEFYGATLALGLNTGAYQTELIRAGILSIPVGQTEASRGLGFTQLQTFRYVILPQALRLIIPPLTNEGINVFLNSSLAYVLSVPELTRKAEDLATKWFLTIPLLATAGIFYFVMTYSLANFSKKLEINMRIPGLGVQHD